MKLHLEKAIQQKISENKTAVSKCKKKLIADYSKHILGLNWSFAFSNVRINVTILWEKHIFIKVKIQETAGSFWCMISLKLF